MNMEKSKGEEFPKLTIFRWMHILYCLYQRLGSVNIIVSFNPQQYEVYKEYTTVFKDESNENLEKDILSDMIVLLPGGLF